MSSILLVFLLTSSAADAGDPCDAPFVQADNPAHCWCVNGTTMNCGTNIGACQLGTQTCRKGMWSPCVGGKMPTVEVLDGIDNNCNGIIDEGFQGVPLYVYIIVGAAVGLIVRWRLKRR